MDLDWIWKAVLIMISGTMLLRVAGRKSISQMTLAQTVIMIAIGSLLVQPIASRNVWITLAVGAALVLTLVIMEYAQLKSDKIENFITGKSQVLIENGNLDEKKMKDLRFTVDMLEMNLRQNNVSKMSDIEWATLEPNGKVGFILKEDAQPATKKEIRMLQEELQQIKKLLTAGAASNSQPQSQQSSDGQSSVNLFQEVKQDGHGGSPPDYLQ